MVGQLVAGLIFEMLLLSMLYVGVLVMPPTIEAPEWVIVVLAWMYIMAVYGARLATCAAGLSDPAKSALTETQLIAGVVLSSLSLLFTQAAVWCLTWPVAEDEDELQTA